MKSLKRGFTLIELLVVIAVIGVLAAVVLVAINPIQKIQQANDSKVKSDIGQIATAMQAYAATHNGNYPATLATLTTTGELQILPVPPSGAGYGTAYTYTVAPGGCTTACTGASVRGTILRPNVVTGAAFWCYRTSQATAGEVTQTAGCPAP